MLNIFKDINLFKAFNVDVKMHCSFYTFFIAYVLIGLFTKGFHTFLVSSAYLIGIFSCVIIHEFCHILMAKKHGIETESILLTMLGGIASFKNVNLYKPMPGEFSIAIVGPLSNIIIAGFLYIIFYLTNINFIKEISYVNIFIGVFNLIPFYPMDGGRILRSVFTGFKVDFYKATKYVFYIGLVIATGFIGFGIYHHIYNLIFIAVLMSFFSGVEVYTYSTKDFKYKKTESDLKEKVKKDHTPYDRYLIATATLDSDNFTKEEKCILLGILSDSDIVKNEKEYDNAIMNAKIKMHMDMLKDLASKHLLMHEQVVPGDFIKDF